MRYTLLLASIIGLVSPANAQTANSSASATVDSEWSTVSSLFDQNPNLRVVIKDSALADRYRQWDDMRKVLLRELGAGFVARYPHDARICEWFLAADAANPSIKSISFDPRPHEPLAGDDMVPHFYDSAAATPQVEHWQAQVPVLRMACVQSPSPDSSRIQVAYEQVEAILRPVQIDLWFPVDTLHPALPDTVHWDELSQTVLNIGAQFPKSESADVRDGPIELLSLMHKYHPSGESTFVAAMERSPNVAVREIGHAKAELAEARRTPMTMHVTTIDGKSIDLKSLRGKLVLLDFWAASWCSACRVQEPFIKSAYEKYHDRGLEIVGIALEDDEHKAFFAKYIKTQGITWPQYFPGGHDATSNEYFRRFGFNGAPQLMLLDRNGLLIGEAPGSNGVQKLEPLIKQQLGDAEAK